MKNRKTLKDKVQTVLGSIASEALGPTLMHEHILCDVTPPGQFDDHVKDVEISLKNTWEIRYHWHKHPGNCRLESEDVAVWELKRLQKAGCRSVVELTGQGMKRNPLGLRQVAEQTGINIIMGAGYYVEEFLGPDMKGRSVEMIAEELISSFYNGVEDTGVRCGIIGEIGCSYPWTELERQIMHAAVHAQLKTGASISVHPGRDPRAPFEVVKFVEERGGDVCRTILGHVDRTIFDTSTLLNLAETGCLIEYDFFGIESAYYPFQDIDLPNDGTRLKFIRSLIDNGHLSQILVSHDICTKTRLVTYGGHGYGHIFTDVVPMMHRRGFTDSEIDAILVDNPRRLLTLA